MHMAAEGNQPSMMIYLITKEHQSSQSVDENGSTPLHWACYAGAEESVNFLLNLDANIDAQDKEKLTPLHLAVLGGREKIVVLFFNYIYTFAQIVPKKRTVETITPHHSSGLGELVSPVPSFFFPLLQFLFFHSSSLISIYL